MLPRAHPKASSSHLHYLEASATLWERLASPMLMLRLQNDASYLLISICIGLSGPIVPQPS